MVWAGFGRWLGWVGVGRAGAAGGGGWGGAGLEAGLSRTSRVGDGVVAGEMGWWISEEPGAGRLAGRSWDGWGVLG